MNSQFLNSQTPKSQIRENDNSYQWDKFESFVGQKQFHLAIEWLENVIETKLPPFTAVAKQGLTKKDKNRYAAIWLLMVQLSSSNSPSVVEYFLQSLSLFGFYSAEHLTDAISLAVSFSPELEAQEVINSYYIDNFSKYKNYGQISSPSNFEPLDFSILWLMVSALTQLRLGESDNRQSTIAVAEAVSYSHFLFKFYKVVENKMRKLKNENSEVCNKDEINRINIFENGIKKICDLDSFIESGNQNCLISLNVQLIRTMELFGYINEYQKGISFLLEILCWMFESMDEDWSSIDELINFINSKNILNKNHSEIILLISCCSVLVVFCHLDSESGYPIYKLLKSLREFAQNCSSIQSLSAWMPRIVACLSSCECIVTSCGCDPVVLNSYPSLPPRKVASTNSDAERIHQAIQTAPSKSLAVKLSTAAEMNDRAVSCFYQIHFMDSLVLFLESLPPAFHTRAIRKFMHVSGVSLSSSTLSPLSSSLGVNSVRNCFVLFEFLPQQNILVDEFCDAALNFGIQESPILFGPTTFKPK